MAVMLLGGANFAWAGTTTYDLYSLAGSGYTTLSWSSSYVSTTDGGNPVNCYYMSVSNGVTVNDLENRIAVSGNSSSSNPWMRSSYGYFFNTKNSTRYIAIPGLKNGDVINIVYSKTEIVTLTTVNDFVHSGGTISAGNAIASNTNYTVSTESSSYDLFIKCVIPNEGTAGANNWYVKSVTITSTSENVSKPTIAITGSSEKTRQVTITAGTSDAGNDVTTYYTTDGSTPTASSPNYFTSASKVITVGESAESESTVTVKAITISSTEVESNVSSNDVKVGTKLQLNAPSITLSSFASAGRFAYNPVYSFTSDQSSIIGTPEPTITYSFNSGSPVEASSYTATASGSITVTVSADGYESNSTILSIDGGNFYKSYSFNAIDDVTVDTSADIWGSATNVGGVQWTFTSLSNCAYSLRADMSLSGFMYARKTTGQVKNGFYSRTGTGTVNFTLESGEYILFTTLGDNVVANSVATSRSFGQYSNVRSIEIFTPATEVDLAILDCKAYDTSAAFATAIDAESFASAAEVYAFNTSYHVTNGVLTDGVRDVTGVIRNAAVADATDWNATTYTMPTKYPSAPDNVVLDAYNYDMDAYQIIYGLPAGTYKVTANSRGSAAGGNSWVYVNTEPWKAGDLAKANTNTVGDGESAGTLGYGFSTQTATFTITEKTNIRLGFYADLAETDKWASCDDWHLYRVESVSGTITDAGWSTFASPYNLDLSSVENGTAYYASAASGSKVTLTSTTATVPAGEGIMIKGTAGETFTIDVAASGTAIDGNLLKGQTTTGNVAASTAGTYHYVFGFNTADPSIYGFYNLASATSVPAGKAYLETTTELTAGARISIVFEDETTGISLTENSELRTENAVYDLQGRRVAQPQKGLYIVNGKKVVIK